jgi:hypothetical protein
MAGKAILTTVVSRTTMNCVEQSRSSTMRLLYTCREGVTNFCWLVKIALSVISEI